MVAASEAIVDPPRHVELPRELYLLPQKLTVRVVNEEGKPVEGARVGIGMGNPWAGPDGVDFLAAHSDADGLASHEAPGTASAEIRVTKEGYYASRTIRYEYDTTPLIDILRRGEEVPQDYRHRPWNPEVEVVLVVKKDPVTMKELWAIDLPEFDREFGIDLLVGDLLAPHGKGKHADLIARTELEIFEDRMYIVALDLEFTGEGNGMIGLEKFPFPDSTFEFLREAPNDGYEVRRFRDGWGYLVGNNGPDAQRLQELNAIYRERTGGLKEHPEAWVFRIRQDREGDGEGPHYGIFVKPFIKGRPLYFTAAPPFGDGEARINLNIRGVINPIVGSRSLEADPPAPRVMPVAPPPPDAVPGPGEVNE